jgi:hypothetical protein
VFYLLLIYLLSCAGLNALVFRQLFEKESSTYTYLLADAVTKEALLIDPVMETVDRYVVLEVLEVLLRKNLVYDWCVLLMWLLAATCTTIVL